ncbi:MAG: type II toxin-antitoxin system RelE/ParE family toxin, partial [Candidatus Pacebacteria bacterium]|nr:type II toxin-antitoxin system RelE/ParE family toxin [Candidatus Paceibacterota bacterium]
MIVSFKHKGLKKLYEKDDRSGLSAQSVPRIEEILAVLDASEKPEEADLPGYRLHSLT